MAGASTLKVRKKVFRLKEKPFSDYLLTNQI
jgi:hypothetical protein